MSLECHLCDYKSEDKNALVGHIHGSHMKLFKAPTVKKCEHCNKSFLTNSGLEKHKSKCPLLVPFGVYKCAYCNLIFKNKKVIFRHTRDIHHFVIDTRKLKLDYSVKLTNDELNSPSFCTPAGRLTKSVPDNDSGIEFKCKVCRQMFKSRGCLKVHIYKEHNLRNSSRQKFPITDIWSCGKCNRTFYKKNTFTRHESYCSVDRSKPTKKSQPMIDYQQRMEKRRAIALEKFERELEKKMNKATIVNFALYGDVFVGASKYVDPDREEPGSSGITATTTAGINNGSTNAGNIVVRDNDDTGIITESVVSSNTILSDRRTIDKEDEYRTQLISNDFYDGDDNDNFNCSYFNYQFFCPEVKCPKCSFICADRETLLKHQRKKHPKRNFVCEYCNNRFASLASLKSHKLKKHFVFEDARPDQKETILKNRKGFYYTVKLFHCKSCTLSFSSNKVLQSHAITCAPRANIDANRCSSSGIINEAAKKLMSIDNNKQNGTSANDNYYSGKENPVKSSEKDGNLMKRRMKELALILKKKPKLDCNSQ